MDHGAIKGASPGIAHTPRYKDVPFNWKQAGQIQAGEMFRIKVTRVADDATYDTLDGNAELLGVLIFEAL